jgi:hypothetical protein
MKTAHAAVLVLVVFWQLGAANGGDATDGHVRAAFALAWQLKHDTRDNRDELAVKLYREAWLGSNPYGDLPGANERAPFPDFASAESILRGEHGDASTHRLWNVTEGICISFFSERSSAIIKTLADDFLEGVRDRRKAAQVLRTWQRHLYQPILYLGEDRTQANLAKQKLEQISRELYPVASKRFQELDRNSPHGGGEPLAYVLRDLGDPRAIPILLGKDGRNVNYYEQLSNLQAKNKADPALVKLLSDPNSGIRGKAAFALAWSGDPTLAPHAMRLLGDESPEVRHEAMEIACTLLASGQRPDLQLRVRSLLHDPDAKVRRACVVHLARLKDVHCATVLLEMLRDESINEWEHSNLVSAMWNLTGSYFGYHQGSDGWWPTTPNNRAAIEKFTAWIGQQQAKQTKNGKQ